MSRFNKINRILFRAVATAGVFAMAAMGAWAQDTATTTIKHGESSYDTQVKNAEVVYVEGNDLILKLENGKIEHLNVPDSDVFTIDGANVSVHELTPGTKLTQLITTTTAPRYVTTVRTVKGRVWHVTAPHSVILTLPDHTNQTFNIPSSAKIMVNGQQKTPFDLRKGMIFEATIVTDDTHTVVESSKSTLGERPADLQMVTPKFAGVVLFLTPSSRPAEPVEMAQHVGETSVAILPHTASVLPLVGLLGGLAIAMSLGLALVRQIRGV